jgi:hypothetical protein
MRHTLVVLAVLAMGAFAMSERGSLDFGFGGGAWVPGLLESGSELEAGPAVSLSLEIPMDQGHVVLLRSGYRTVSTDRDGYESVSAVPLTIGYRIYPFYKPYAGPRGLEPLFGVYGGGILAWDSVEGDSIESTTTGGGVIGAEIGARISLSEGAGIDVIVMPEWVPLGGELAGEESGVLSGLLVYAGVVF